MSDQEEAVLAAFREFRAPFRRCAEIARVLNFAGPCAWCPVGPPRAGERCATVPKESREAVGRVLKRLVAAGRVRVLHPGTRLRMYALPEATP